MIYRMKKVFLTFMDFSCAVGSQSVTCDTSPSVVATASAAVVAVADCFSVSSSPSILSCIAAPTTSQAKQKVLTTVPLSRCTSGTAASPSVSPGTAVSLHGCLGTALVPLSTAGSFFRSTLYLIEIASKLSLAASV